VRTIATATIIACAAWFAADAHAVPDPPPIGGGHGMHQGGRHGRPGWRDVVSDAVRLPAGKVTIKLPPREVLP
jgi:hypothetical protein